MTTVIADIVRPTPAIISTTLDIVKHVVITSHENRIAELEKSRVSGLSIVSSLHYFRTGVEVLIFEAMNDLPTDDKHEQQSNLEELFWK